MDGEELLVIISRPVRIRIGKGGLGKEGGIGQRKRNTSWKKVQFNPPVKRYWIRRSSILPHRFCPLLIPIHKYLEARPFCLCLCLSASRLHQHTPTQHSTDATHPSVTIDASTHLRHSKNFVPLLLVVDRALFLLWYTCFVHLL